VQELADQVAVISGGLGDIGRACAVELARRGADVAVGDARDAYRAGPLRAEIEGLGRRFRFDQVDVSDSEAVSHWVDAVESDLGAPSLAIPNAAIDEYTPFEKLTPEIWRRHIDVNLNGAFYLAHTVARRLFALNKPGRIVFIGSWAGHAPHAHLPAYGVAKAGLRMLCRCMALDYAPHGILINEVAPGFVNAGTSGEYFRQHPEAVPEALAKVPVGRLMDPDEVAMHLAYLCDPKNRHMAGSVLVCDGGLSTVTAVWRGVDGKRPGAC
jgi:NAD(P)-dependent dehydrogenase (short-subunit alcohol dehydrogenase family)